MKTGSHLCRSRSVPLCAITRASRQVAAHQNRVQFLPAPLPVVALAPPGDGKSRPVIKPPSRPIIFLDFQQYAAHAARGKVAEVRQQKLAGKPPAAMARLNRDRKYLGFIRRHSRSGKTDNLATDS